MNKPRLTVKHHPLDGWRPNLAQIMYLSLGVPRVTLELGSQKSPKNPCFTKKGPGRYHKNGKNKTPIAVNATRTAPIYHERKTFGTLSTNMAQPKAIKKAWETALSVAKKAIKGKLGLA